MYRFTYDSQDELPNEKHIIDSTYNDVVNISEVFARFIFFLRSVSFSEEAIKKEITELAKYFEQNGDIADLG